MKMSSLRNSVFPGGFSGPRPNRLSVARLCLVVMVGFTMVQLPASAAEEKENHAAEGAVFSEYDLVLDRNIFDPDRGRRPPPAPLVRQREAPPPPPPSVHMDLTGVLLAGKDSVAFLEGNAENIPPVCRLGDDVAGMQLVGIRSGHVILATTERRVQFVVGKSLVKEDGGSWEVSSESLVSNGAGAFGKSQSGGASSFSKGGGDGDDSSKSSSAFGGSKTKSSFLKSLFSKKDKKKKKK